MPRISIWLLSHEDQGRESLTSFQRTAKVSWWQRLSMPGNYRKKSDFRKSDFRKRMVVFPWWRYSAGNWSDPWSILGDNSCVRAESSYTGRRSGSLQIDCPLRNQFPLTCAFETAKFQDSLDWSRWVVRKDSKRDWISQVTRKSFEIERSSCLMK